MAYTSSDIMRMQKEAEHRVHEMHDRAMRTMNRGQQTVPGPAQGSVSPPRTEHARQTGWGEMHVQHASSAEQTNNKSRNNSGQNAGAANHANAGGNASTGHFTADKQPSRVMGQQHQATHAAAHSGNGEPSGLFEHPHQPNEPVRPLMLPAPAAQPISIPLLKGLNIRSDTLIILAMIFLLLRKEGNNYLILALAYILL